MTKRDVGFFLVGLGLGLIFAVVAIIEFVLWFHSMFIIGVHWRPGSVVLTLPLILILIGFYFLYRSKASEIEAKL